MEAVKNNIFSPIAATFKAEIKERICFDLNLDKALSLWIHEAKKIEPKYQITQKEKYIVSNLILWLEGNNFKSIDPITKKEIEGDLSKGIYLAGNTGSGKTLIMSVLKEMVKYDHVIYRYNNSDYHIGYEIKPSRNIVKQFIKGGFDAVDLYFNKCSFCVDDLGADKPAQYMGNQIDIISDILCERHEQRNSFYTLITSNYPLYSDQIKERYGDRMQSRLFEMCNYYELVQEDYRKKN